MSAVYALVALIKYFLLDPFSFMISRIGAIANYSMNFLIVISLFVKNLSFYPKFYLLFFTNAVFLLIVYSRNDS